MATLEIPVLGGIAFNPDTSGDCFVAPISTQLTLTNSKRQKIVVLKDPGGGGDHGFEDRLHVPKGYVDTPILVVQYVIDGDPTSTTIAFGVQGLELQPSEAFDAAYGTQDIVSKAYGGSPTEVDKDLDEQLITLTNMAPAEDDSIDYFFYIDDGVNTFTGNCLLTYLGFRYNDA